MAKIAIIGTGFGGMAAAYDLAKAGHKVTIFERRITSAGWPAGSRNQTGTGRWKSSTTIGSPATSICWG